MDDDAACGPNKTWLRRVLRHESGLPVPWNLMLSPPARRRLEEHFGTTDVEAFLGLPLRMMGTRSVKPLYAPPQEFGSHVTDEFGVVWTTSEIDRGCPVGPPITEPNLAGYSFPDPSAAYRFEHLGEWCERNADHYTIVWVGDLWERATFLCGMERLLLFLVAEPGFVRSLLRGIADGVLRTMDVLLAGFAFDGIALSDDYGTQGAMLMSPAAWRRFVKPLLAEILGRARAAGRTTFLHSCGNVRAIVPDLVDLGLDVLHPIQPEAMDILELKREFGSDLTFCGGLGTQQLLVEATPREVRDEVRRLQREMGRGGGYILEPGITIQADVPLANMLALIDAATLGRGGEA